MSTFVDLMLRWSILDPTKKKKPKARWRSPCTSLQGPQERQDESHKFPIVARANALSFPWCLPRREECLPQKPLVPWRLDILFQVSSLSKMQNGCAHAIRDGRFTLVGYHHMLVTFPLAKVINQTRRRTPLISWDTVSDLHYVKKGV